MPRKKRNPPIGARPGTLVIDAGLAAPEIRLIRYSKDSIREAAVRDVETLRQTPGSPDFHWIDVQGLGDQKILETLGEIFSIHPLALEDVVHAPIRPKSEVYDHNLFVVARMLHGGGQDDVDAEQVSIFVGKNYVLTFQERSGDILDPVRARLRAGHRMIRSAGSGYLAYAILDTIVDGYLPVIEQIGDRLEAMEERVMEHPTPQTLRDLNKIKNLLVRVRRAITPQREAVSSLVRDENEFVGDATRMYLRDTYDHCVMTSEALETSREFVNGLMNTYLSVVSNRMNEVMKTLTIVASIFVPLTFMAGVYGMNFERMPELHWKWSYPLLLLSMGLVGAGMVYYFHRKGWIGRNVDPEDDSRAPGR